MFDGVSLSAYVRFRQLDLASCLGRYFSLCGGPPDSRTAATTTTTRTDTTSAARVITQFYNQRPETPVMLGDLPGRSRWRPRAPKGTLWSLQPISRSSPTPRFSLPTEEAHPRIRFSTDDAEQQQVGPALYHKPSVLLVCPGERREREDAI